MNNGEQALLPGKGKNGGKGDSCGEQEERAIMRLVALKRGCYADFFVCLAVLRSGARTISTGGQQKKDNTGCDALYQDLTQRVESSVRSQSAVLSQP